MDCAHLPLLSLEELGRRLRKRPSPLGGGMEVTYRCNLRCVHCYCRCEAGDARARASEMSLATIRHIVDQAAEMGTFWMSITGGEPLLRPDILDIYDHIKSKGILPILFTNGTLVTPRIADHLAQNPPLSVEVSIYGRTAATYESITGIPGSHARCIQGIRELVDRGIKVFLKTPVMVQNRHEIHSLEEFAESLGCSFRFGALLNPRLEHMEDRYGPYGYGLSLEDHVELELGDDSRLKAWSSLRERMAATPQQDTVYTCGAGLFGYFIDAEGHMTMCVIGRSPSYDLKSGTFREGWDLLRHTRQEVTNAETSLECRTCEHRVLCQQCPARAQLEYGEGAETQRVDWLCELAHIRAERLRTKQGVKR